MKKFTLIATACALAVVCITVVPDARAGKGDCKTPVPTFTDTTNATPKGDCFIDSDSDSVFQRVINLFKSLV